MKNSILTILLFACAVSGFSQTAHTDAYLENRVDSLIRPKTYNPGNTSNIFDLFKDSKVSILAPKLTNSSTSGYVWTATNTSGNGSWQAPPTSSLSALTVATGTNAINNNAYKQEWQWNTLAATDAFKLSSTSTLVDHTAGTNGLLSISMSGANSTAAKTAIGFSSKVANTNATSGTNIAGYFSASGATTANWAGYFDGSIKINGSVDGFYNLIGASGYSQLIFSDPLYYYGSNANIYMRSIQTHAFYLNDASGNFKFSIGAQDGNIETAGTIKSSSLAGSGTRMVTTDASGNLGAASIFSNPMSTDGDMIVGGTSGAPTSLPVGANGEILRTVSGLPAWSTDLQYGYKFRNTTAIAGSVGSGSLLSFSSPTVWQNSSTVFVEVTITGVETTTPGASSFSYKLEGTFRKDSGGTVTKVSAVTAADDLMKSVRNNSGTSLLSTNTLTTSAGSLRADIFFLATPGKDYNVTLDIQYYYSH